MTATSPVDAAPAERFPCFDGLRAVAATGVLLHHAAVATVFILREIDTPWGRWQIGRYFNHMDAGVQVFFLISGFLLYRPFVAAAFGVHAPVDRPRFFRRRLLRIYPAYWVAFVAIALFIRLDLPVGGARTMVENFFLVHLYDLGDGGLRALGGISQSWTLVVELSFYAFLPAFAWLVGRWMVGRTDAERLRIQIRALVILYAVSVAWRAMVFWLVPEDAAFRFVGQYWLPAHLDLFAMGMGLAVAHVWNERHGPVPVLERIGRFDLLWWGLGFAAFTLVVYGVGLPRVLVAVYGWKAYARQFLYGLTALFVLLPAVFGPQDRGVVRRFLRLAPVAALGVVSYGIYLWHQAFIKKIHQWGGWAPGPGEDALAGFRGNFLVHATGALALSIVVATASWFLVEKPLLSRRRPRVQTSA